MSTYEDTPIEYAGSNTQYTTFADSRLENSWVVDLRGVYHHIDSDGTTDCGFEGKAFPASSPEYSPVQEQVCDTCGKRNINTFL